MKILIYILFIIFLLQNTSANSIANVVKVTYKLSHQKITPGDTLLIEFTFKIKKGWHIYWTNPGDAGLPTIIEPKDNKIGKQLEVLMDIPKILKEEDLVFYCYEDKTTMVLKFVIDQSAKMGKNHLDYEISWLMCKNECYPGKINLNIPLTISNQSVFVNKIDIDKYPKTHQDEQINTSIVDDVIFFEIPKNNSSVFNFYPITPGYLAYDKIKINKKENTFEVHLKLDKFRENDPSKLDALFVFQNNSSKRKKISYYTKLLIKN